MNTNALAYTVFDEMGRAFDDWLSRTPYWVIVLIISILAILLIIGLVKKLVVFTVVVGALALAVFGFWFYATNYT